MIRLLIKYTYLFFMEKIFYTINNIDNLVDKLLDISKSKVFCFYGEMGAGKTTLIKSIVHKLGAKDHASSPTFGFVNEYHHKDGRLLGYHFDFYRLQNEIEALDLGLEEYFNQKSWLFIEWPNKVENLLPPNYTKITIKVVEEISRELEIEHVLT